MNTRTVYTSEQLNRMAAAYKVICAYRNIDPRSDDGRELALEMLERCEGTETEAYRETVR